MIYEGSVKGPHVLQPIVPVAVTMVTPASAGPGLLYAGSVASSLARGVQRQRPAPAYSNNGHLFIFIFRSDN